MGRRCRRLEADSSTPARLTCSAFKQGGGEGLHMWRPQGCHDQPRHPGAARLVMPPFASVGPARTKLNTRRLQTLLRNKSGTARRRRAAHGILMAGTLCSALVAGAGWPASASSSAMSLREDGAVSGSNIAHRLASGALGNLLTYDYDNSRSGDDPTGPQITSLSATPAWDNHLDGAVYGQPLVDDGTIYVATEDDTIYAIQRGHRRRELEPASGHAAQPLGRRLGADAEPALRGYQPARYHRYACHRPGAK